MEKENKSRMYSGVKTWNPFKGCKFDCIYCKPSFQQQSKRIGEKCPLCYNYDPHEHQDRLKRSMPSAKIIFVCGNGDISFAKPEFVRQIIEHIKGHLKRCPYKQFYFQSKNPACFEQYLADFPKDNTILLATLETNRDEGYDQISKALVPSQRYHDFKALNWHRKVLTIEPIMKFDHDIFLKWILELQPKYVWLGYNSRTKQVQLPEPDLTEVDKLIEALKKENIEVKIKHMIWKNDY